MGRGVTGAALWAVCGPLMGVGLMFSSGCDCGGTGLKSGRPVIGVEVTGLDFGAIPEATREVRGLQIDNPGLKTLEITATIKEGSPDFAVVNPQISIPSSRSALIEIAFTPEEEGEDSAILLLSSNDPITPELEIDLHGGPIEARLVVNPDPVVVAGGQPLETIIVTLRNDGMAHLDLRSIGVDPTGSPDFSVRASGIPVALPYRQELTVEVDYARSTNPDQGRMIILSNDTAGEQKMVQLLPAPVALCADQIDNDLDGLTDYPDDPGCLDADDDDEEDPPECVDTATQPCGDDTGACVAGTRTCVAGHWEPCQGATGPGVESCNGEDDDCDGSSDEGLTVACGAGVCAGNATCVPDSGVVGGEWGPCVVPGTGSELCNGVDDDCDGQTDENLSQMCTSNGCVGTQACLMDGSGQWEVCQADTTGPETCNGLDDNCDGSTDEGLPPPTCVTNGCAGTRTCQGIGGWSSCNPDFVDPESCDGIDNDCDGTTDEDVSPQACTTTTGCTGTRSCLVGGTGQWGQCLPDSATAELCNNVDDDCDGSTDEDFPSLNGGCDVGVGECLASGIVVCTAAGGGTECSANPDPPGTEVCNGLDDDCDTLDDNGLGPVQSANQFGACAGNQDLCQGAAGYQPDLGNYTPTGESCNGVDDDCDDVVDDGEDPQASANQEGRCAGNQEICTGAAGYQPAATNYVPGPESCNGLDDNCDTNTDEGLDPRLTATQSGECAGNTENCAGSGGWQEDAANHVSTPEICNGLDDNCDASTDEGLATRLTANQFGECGGNLEDCTGAGGYQPDPGNYVSTVESCNGLDDNCDNVVDDTMIPVPTANQDGLCAGNQQVCNGAAGYQDDTGNWVPAGEICNGLDEDCDGTDDNGLVPRLTTNQDGECLGNEEYCGGSLGWLDEVTNYTPVAESCNGLDDDCDGTDDNGVAPVLTANQDGECAGNQQICTSGTYQDDPTNYVSTAEVCNSLDDDCDGVTDNGVCSGCDPDGAYTITSGGPLSYTCVFGLVNISIDTFTFSSDGAVINTSPTNPNSAGVTQALDGAATTCPSGSFVNGTTLTGGCAEVYTLTGSFDDADNWTGTYSVNFVGSCFDCTFQSWNITAQRP